MDTQILSQKLYLEDLKVGQEFMSDPHPLDAEQIIAYARQFDPQPFHLDEEAAKNTFFRGLAASGWHTMSITMKLMVQNLPFSQGVIGAGGDIAWPRPTRPGDILRVKSTLREIIPSKSKPDRGIVRVYNLTLNQADEVLQELTANLLVFRKP